MSNPNLPASSSVVGPQHHPPQRPYHSASSGGSSHQPPHTMHGSASVSSMASSGSLSNQGSSNTGSLSGGFAQQHSSSSNRPSGQYPPRSGQGSVQNTSRPPNPARVSSSMNPNINSSRPPTKKHPPNQPYTTPSSHYHHGGMTNIPGYNQTQPSGTKLACGKVVVDLLSPKLGFPDVYPCEQHSRIPEVIFSSTFAREGYVDKTFSKIDHQEINSSGSFFLDSPFFANLERCEQNLREEHKSFSTNKTREEMKQRFDNAVNSCNCTATTTLIPKTVESYSMFKVLAGKTEDQKRPMNNMTSPRIPLRELVSKVAKYFVKPNFFELLASHNIPYFRALWYTKILIRDNSAASNVNVKDLSLDLTNKLCEHMLNICSEENSDPKKRQSVMYTINFLAYCLEEKMLNESILCQKLLEMLESKFGLKPKASKDVSLMDAYFFSLLSIKSNDQIFQNLTNTINSSKKVGPVTKFYILQFFKLYMTYSSDPKFSFEVYRRLNPGQQQLSLDNVKHLLYKPKDDIFAINVLDRTNCNIPEIYNTLLYNKDIGINLISGICEWAITSKRQQNHRPYVVGTLVNYFIKQNPSLKKQVEESLFREVLGYCEESSEDTSLNIIKLFNELILQNNFSISEYIKYLTARGFNVSKTDKFNTTHSYILRNLPSYDALTKNKINSKLYGPRFDSENSEAKKIQTSQNDIKENISKIIYGGLNQSDMDETVKSVINSIRDLPLKGAQFEITQWISDELKFIDSSLLSEDIIDNLLAITLTVSNYRAFRDIIFNILNKLVSGECKYLGLEMKLFSIIRNGIHLFISLDDSEIIDLFQKRYKTINSRNFQIIIYKYLTEISNCEAFKAKISKFISVVENFNTPAAPLNLDFTLNSMITHPFIEYVKKEGINLIHSNPSSLVSEYTLNNPQRFTQEQVFILLRVLFAQYHHHKHAFFIRLLRDMSLQSSLFDNSAVIECLTHVIVQILDDPHSTTDVIISLIQFIIESITNGLISGYTFINNILFRVFDLLMQKITNLKSIINQPIAFIFFYIYFLRIFVNFSFSTTNEKINALMIECNIPADSVTWIDEHIYSNIITNTFYDFLGPFESKELISKLAVYCKTLYKEAISSHGDQNRSKKVYESMVEILLDYLGNPKALKDISRSISYTQDCLGLLYELPSKGKEIEYGNKYQTISTLIESLIKPFSSEATNPVPGKLFAFLSHSTSINDYLNFVMDLSKSCDKWRIPIDSHILFIYMFTWNKRKPLQREQYLHFATRKGKDDSFFYAKSLLPILFYTPFAAFQDIVLELFRSAITYNEKRQQDVENLLPTIDELIRLDQGKAEIACRHILDSINGTLKDQNSPNIREKLTTALFCLKDIIFYSPLLENPFEDRSSDKKNRLQIIFEIKKVLIMLSTSKIIPNIFNSSTSTTSSIVSTPAVSSSLPTQTIIDLSLTDIYYLIYSMLLKLKIPQEELNKDFERFFQQREASLSSSSGSSSRSIQQPPLSYPPTQINPSPGSASSTGTPSNIRPSTTPRGGVGTPSSGTGKASPIKSPQQSPLQSSIIGSQPTAIRNDHNKISNWLVIEDYVIQCPHCGSSHGNLTPARYFGSKVVKKTELLFGKKVAPPSLASSSGHVNHHSSSGSSDSSMKKRKLAESSDSTPTTEQQEDSTSMVLSDSPLSQEPKKLKQ
ncbi:hypothetical protein C9374_001893 [Naegleria lovaniensis]|uniref:Mediator complex subunit Med12 domain-containing protein n=1 Tax=Naegleria lovaniensis TaxID=51637 RepID=A0AA88KLN8_NAELO|nr:uncharacterized protein C9374_001893 [Naegleria lovaniensis]KAG2386858.1 hypothetical protein C9374_001893 [Naegleria lovaniensis]